MARTSSPAGKMNAASSISEPLQTMEARPVQTRGSEHRPLSHADLAWAGTRYIAVWENRAGD
jgi:hypothetical protein